jgi:hypothetical protein
MWASSRILIANLCLSGQGRVRRLDWWFLIARSQSVSVGAWVFESASEGTRKVYNGTSNKNMKQNITNKTPSIKASRLANCDDVVIK